MHIDDVNVKVSVVMTAVVTLRVGQGPITKEMVAESLKERDLKDMICAMKVIDLHKNDGTRLVEATF